MGPWGARLLEAWGDGGRSAASWWKFWAHRVSLLCVWGDSEPSSLGLPPQPTGSQSVLLHTNLLPSTQGGRPLLADSLSPPPSVWSGKRPLPVCPSPTPSPGCPVRPQQPGRGKASVLGKNPEQSAPGAGVLGTSTGGRGDASWNLLATPGREAQRTSSDLGEGGWDAEAAAWVLASRKPSLTSGASFDSPISAVSLLGPSEGSASTGPSMAWLLQNSESSSGVGTERTARNRREKEGHVCEGSGSVCVWARRCKWDVRLECVAQAGEQPWVGRATGE